MLKGSREERALQSVAEDARRQGAPELSDQLEERLIDAISKPSAALAERRSARRIIWLVPAVAACAAAGAALIVWPRGPVLPEPAALVQPANEHDGDTLTPARVVRALEEPREVRHAGRARWWLERGSEAVVLEAGEMIRVRLLTGALRAEVVPDPRPERFVVEAGETRVAVHGTVFRVALDGGESVVEVEEGTVAVASLSGGGDPLFLRAPSRGRFGLDGHLESPPAPHKKTTRAPAARKPASETAPRVSPSTVMAEEPPRELTIGEVEAGVETVVQAITRCFEEHTAPDGDVRIRVNSTVTLAVAPDGAIADVTFSPPLSPAVQACSERDVTTARFAESTRGATVTRVIELFR